MREATPPPQVSAFLTHLRIERGLTENTRIAYARDLRYLCETLRDRAVPDPAAATPADLIAHVIALSRERGLDPATVARHIAAIRAFYQWICAERRIADNPADLLERPALWDRLPSVLSLRDMERLLATPAPDPQAPPDAIPLWIRDRAILELLYGCGLRASEVATIRADDLVPTLGVVRVMGKGRKERVVPFGAPARDAIADYLEACRPRLVRDDAPPSPMLLLSRTGRPLERVAIWQIVKRHATNAGLAHAYPHLMRHSFATHLLAGGADLRVVQELLGHANITTTQIYTRVEQSHLTATHKRFHPRA